MEERVSTLSTIQSEGTQATLNDGASNSTRITSLTRARVSKVLKRLKTPKWRKRHSSSRSASEALDAVSESDSVCSGVDSSLTSNRSESFDNPNCSNTDGENYFSENDFDEASNHVETSRKCRTMVVYEPNSSRTTSSSMALRSSRNPSFPETLDMWVSTAHALLQSREMNAFVHSSNRVIASAVTESLGATISASGLVVRTAFLPVTLPLHVAASTTDLVINAAGTVLNAVLGDDDGDADEVGSDVYHTPVQDLVHHVVNFIPFLFETAVHLVTPAPGMAMRPHGSSGQAEEQAAALTKTKPRTKSTTCESASRSCGKSCGETVNDDFLQRLRLDIIHPAEEGVTKGDDDATTRSNVTDSTGSIHGNPSGATKSDVSKFLLRVDDIHVMAPPDPAFPDKELSAYYIDLGEEFGDEGLTRDALAKLIQRCLTVATSNRDVDITLPKPPALTLIHRTNDIEWQPQGQTRKDCKRLSEATKTEFFKQLQSHVLIWSGKYSGPKYHGSDNPLFMARGVVKGSPREFVNMLWDSRRTTEYNKYCLGRKDVIVLHDEISKGGLRGAKVIKSETKVPFTSLSVFLTVLMHARAWGDGPDDGFIIFSRSLDTGRAGCHVGKSALDHQSNKNEIIVGINIMKPVPNHPELTDLISVSQVNSSMVPPFLAFRIGMMGVEDFFKNVR